MKISRITLGLKISLAFLLVALIPLTIFSVLVYSHVKEETAKVINGNLNNLSYEVGVEVDRTIFYASGHIKSLAENPAIKSAQTSIEDKLVEMQKIQNLYKTFEDITLINLDGVVLASTTYDFRGDWKYKLWFKKSAGGNSSVSPVHVILNPARFVLVMTLPIKDKDGEVIAVLAGRVNMERIWEITDKVKIGNTGFIFISDRFGNLIACPDKQNVLFKLTPEDLKQKIITGEFGTARFVDKGLGKICHYQLLKGYKGYRGQGWRIGIIQDFKEAYHVVDQLREQILIALICGILVIFLLAVILTRNIVRPVRALVKGTQRIAKGDLNTVVDVKTRDEIGDLGKAFNKMTRELKEFQSQLVQSEKLSVMGLLAAGVAHELNNPLAGLLTLLRMCKTNSAGPKDFEKFGEMVKAAEHIAKISQDLTSFSRESKGEFIALSLNEVIESTLTFSGYQLIKNHIKLIKDYGVNLPKIKGDQSRLQQVVLNMITNARDAMPNGGEFTIRTAVAKEGDKVLVEFVDTGTGIKDEDIPKIFSPFFTTKPVGKGTGLGLSVSQEIVRNHKGEIWVESKLGKGTKFTITIPKGD